MNRYYSDESKLKGYYAIEDRLDDDAYIWVNCTLEQLHLFIEALNRACEGTF